MSMTETITGAEVWSASLTDPAFAKELTENSVRDTIRPFTEAAPVAIAEHLGKLFSLQSLVDAKISFLQHNKINGYARKFSEVVDRSEERVTAQIDSVIDALSDIAIDIPDILEKCKFTEEQVILDERTGLSCENQDLYRAGTLTVADVLRTQPVVILRNNKLLKEIWHDLHFEPS